MGLRVSAVAFPRALRARGASLYRGAVLIVGAIGLVAVGSGFGVNDQRGHGGRIAFAMAPGAPGSGDLYVINADGTSRRRLTNGGPSEANPTWSRDGKSLAYVSLAFGAGSQSSLNAISAAGRNPHVLFSENPAAHGIIDSPDWSPDGRRIAFGSVRSGSYQVWTYALNGGKFAEVTHSASGGDPSWSPNGRQLAYTGVASTGGHGSIYVIDANGSNNHDVSRAPVEDESATWSPTGAWIALRSLNADWPHVGESDSLVIVNAAGTVRKTLVSGGAIFPDDWSPNGDKILFTWVSDPAHPSSTRRQLYTISVNGGAPHAVPGTQGAIGGASWHR